MEIQQIAQTPLIKNCKVSPAKNGLTSLMKQF